MSARLAALRIAHSSPGRLRLRAPAAWIGRQGDRLESRLREVPGVRSVTASARTGSVLIAYDPQLASADHLVSLIRPSARLAPESAPGRDRTETVQLLGERALSWLVLVATTCAVGGSFLPLAPATRTALVLAADLPALVRAGHALAIRRRLNVDLLHALALGLLVGRGNFRAAGLLSWLESVGRFVLGRTVVRTRRSLRGLIAPPGQRVWRIEGDRRREVPGARLRPGQLVAVRAGQQIPVDGTVVSGEALVDQRAITGEGLSVERRPGDTVYAWSTIDDGELIVRVERVGLDTVVGRIVQSVEAAAVEKAELQVFAEKLADRLVGRTLLLAGAGAAITRNVDAGVAILVADYGLAARVGVPSAVMGAVLRASRAGILIKGPRVVEQLARVDTAVFDKTGTLTLGAPQVTRVVAYPPIEEPDEILRLAAAAERGLPHPVARAVMRAAAVRGITAPPAAEGELRVGLGVEVTVDGVRVQVGSRRFMEANEISLGAAARDERAAHERGGSVSFLAQNGRLAGMIVLEDELRPDAQEAVKALRSRRMRNVIMVSGDHREATEAMAAALGIRHYYPELLPEDKAKLVRELRKEGRVVAMIGDGVNDAPALREADVGIAVQGGVPVAAETAGVVLTRGGLEKVVEALDLARGGIAAVDRALNAAVKGNVAAIGLASIGLGGPFTSILVAHGAAVAGAFSTLPRPRVSRRGRRRHQSDPTAQ